jgi:tetratricopeptide (TPR) repeat protein
MLSRIVLRPTWGAGSQVFVFLLAVLGLRAVVVSAPRQQPVPAPERATSRAEPERLEVGTPIERELAGGETHTYAVRLEAGQYLHAVAQQKGIDVVVTLSDPSGAKLVEVDSPNGTEGPEPVSYVAETAGTYNLEVRSLDASAPAGRYEVKVLELHTATDRDREMAEARSLEAKAIVLSAADKTGEAVPLNERAISLYEKALGSEHPDLAMSLDNLAGLYRKQGQYAKAEPLMVRALAIREKALGPNHPDVATSLNNLVDLYYFQG